MQCQDNGRPFTVYKIHVATTSGRYFELSERYSSFYALYLKCKEKYFVNVPFPPKKLSNSSTKVRDKDSCLSLLLSFLQLLDLRRQELESYLQCLATIDPIPPALTQFLNLESVTMPANSASRWNEIIALFFTVSDNFQLKDLKLLLSARQSTSMICIKMIWSLIVCWTPFTNEHEWFVYLDLASVIK